MWVCEYMLLEHPCHVVPGKGKSGISVRLGAKLPLFTITESFGSLYIPLDLLRSVNISQDINFQTTVSWAKGF